MNDYLSKPTCKRKDDQYEVSSSRKISILSFFSKGALVQQVKEILIGWPITLKINKIKYDIQLSYQICLCHAAGFLELHEIDCEEFQQSHPEPWRPN